MEGKYGICHDLCFKLNVGSRRSHEVKLFKKKIWLDIGKIAFSNRVVGNWSSLPKCCINCSTSNTLKTLSVKLESGAGELYSFRFKLLCTTAGDI